MVRYYSQRSRFEVFCVWSDWRCCGYHHFSPISSPSQHRPRVPLARSCHFLQVHFFNTLPSRHGTCMRTRTTASNCLPSPPLPTAPFHPSNPTRSCDVRASGLPDVFECVCGFTPRGSPGRRIVYSQIRAELIVVCLVRPILVLMACPHSATIIGYCGARMAQCNHCDLRVQRPARNKK